MIPPGAVRALLVCAALGALSATAATRTRPAQAPTSAVAGRWFKGNTHTHTLNSDGDSTPDDVVRWYREHGYNFLVLTDHNYLTSVAGLNAVHGAADKFIVIPGEEVTMSVASKPVHVNGLDLPALVPPPPGRHGAAGTAACRRRHPRRRRCSAHQSPELRLGDHHRGSRPGRTYPAVRDLQRPPAGEQRRRRGRAGTRGDLGSPAHRRTGCFTGLPSTMRITSSDRAIRLRPGRDAGGSTSTRRRSSRRRSSSRSIAATSTRRPAWSCPSMRRLHRRSR